MLDNDILHINLTNFEERWYAFAEKILAACINRDKLSRNGYLYSMSYDYDTIELCNNKLVDEILNPVKSVTLTKDEYLHATKDDKDLIESLFNTIQSS